jgi:sugar lactone lactonase YvrE
VSLWELEEGEGCLTFDSLEPVSTGRLGPACQDAAPEPAWTAGAFGGALAFDGVDDEVVVPDPPALSPSGGGVDFWIFPQEWPSGDDIRLVVKTSGDPNLPGPVLAVQKDAGSQSLKLVLRDPAGALREAEAVLPAMPLMRWVHVAAAWGPGGMRLYLDGRLEAFDPYDGAILDDPGPFRIGGDAAACPQGPPCPSNARFRGIVDQVRFSSPAPADAEVAASPRPDFDGVGAACDTCPEAYDPGQEDADGDGRGDACDCAPEDPSRFEGGVEGCDGADNDCDGIVPPNEQVTAPAAIGTLAGTGEAAFSGDGGPASGAALESPAAAVATAGGDVYIADAGNARIRRVAAGTGLIETVAGGGTMDGDGVPATSVRLGLPQGLAIDPAGDLILADAGRHRVRKIETATGIISTLAGTGEAGFSGDGGPAPGAALSAPAGVAVDPGGNVFVSDRGNHRVRRIDAATGTISTVAGTGAPAFSGDGGPARLAALSGPWGIVLDARGNLLVADEGNHRVRRIDATTGAISTIAGDGVPGSGGDGGPAPAASLHAPRGLALDAWGNLHVADSGNHRIRRIQALAGRIVTIAGDGLAGFGGDGGPAAQARLAAPSGIAAGAAGGLLIADTGNHRVREVAAASVACSDVDGDGYGSPDHIACPAGCVADCDDADARSWGVPGLASDLRFSDQETLTWAPPATSGGSVVSYDVIRSGTPPDFDAGGSCLVSDAPSATSAADPAVPSPGSGFFYLVRAENPCGTIGAGAGSGGAPRPARACP